MLVQCRHLDSTTCTGLLTGSLDVHMRDFGICGDVALGRNAVGVLVQRMGGYLGFLYRKQGHGNTITITITIRGNANNPGWKGTWFF